MAIELFQGVCTFLFAAPSAVVTRMLEAHRNLRDEMVPISYTLAATILVWFLIPFLLREFYKNIKDPYELPGPIPPIRYEDSYWGALQDPLRCLFTFFAASLICYMVEPHVTSEYVLPTWKGTAMASFVWFLKRWKNRFFARVSRVMNVIEADREDLSTLEKLLNEGLCVLGLLAFAAACGVTMQYILMISLATIWVIVRVAEDIIQNVYGGYIMQTSQYIVVGDSVKVRSVREGQVIEVGLTRTLLLVGEEIPITLPNKVLYWHWEGSRQSADRWQAMNTKIRLHASDLQRIHLISNELKNLLISNQKVLQEEHPSCFLASIEKGHAALIMACGLKHMNREEVLSTEQEIVQQSTKIIKNHGCTPNDVTLQYFANPCWSSRLYVLQGGNWSHCTKTR